MRKRTPAPCSSDACGENYVKCGTTKTMYAKGKCRCDACYAVARRYYKEWLAENVAKQEHYHAEYRAKNRERIRESNRRYRNDNREAVLERNRQRYLDNRELILAQKSEYFQENKTEILRRRKESGLDAKNYHNRRARKFAAFVEEVNPTKVFEAANYICQKCGVNCRESSWPSRNYPTLDHVIPLARGGKHEYSNVQLLCHSCNTSKGARMT